jgi:hypothetical protein
VYPYVCVAAAQAEVRDSKRATLLQLLETYQAEKAQVQQQPTPSQLQGISRCAAAAGSSTMKYCEGLRALEGCTGQ